MMSADAPQPQRSPNDVVITILTPCFNELENVRSLHERIRAAVSQSSGAADGSGPPPRARFVHLFIDNASTDGTQTELSKLVAEAGNA